MRSSEIRSRFLQYFSQHGHTIVESASLVPGNDPSLLFTTAGMVPFKDVFLGKETRPYTRATSCQKCVRAGGKHNDLENVGFTARHHTFFEMLGNFSFGDYFKEEAIRMAWSFVTKELQIPVDKLYVTVFRDDQEAYEIWQKRIGLPTTKIFRFDEKDNFWSMGDTGPCGPCSEIFVDRGEIFGCGKTSCAMGCDCDRYMEIWNLVFMQYDRDSSGVMHPLPKPSVDTGAGLERLAAVLQGVDSNYDTDGFLDIIEKTAKLVGKEYDPKSPERFPLRVIADHARAATFLISDGVMPGNEGRAYVLRRILRRAVRYGRNIGFSGPFIYQVAGFVIAQMREAYPDLVDKASLITRAIMAEEEQFFRTLERGLSLLDNELPAAKVHGKLSGDVAFRLYDTFGFPLDLTRIICSEQAIAVDEDGFAAAMERQKAQSRLSWKGSGDAHAADIYFELQEQLRAAKTLPQFTGYESLSQEGTCLGIVQLGEPSALVQSYTSNADQDVLLAVAFSPVVFYAESGGQTGDRGRVSGHGFKGQVVDVQKPTADLIVAHVRPEQGTLKVGSRYQLETDREIRAATARNHTATHILHWALRKMLGDHVQQAGSLVSPELLRFDFSHFQALTAAELQDLEDLINAQIWGGHAVQKREMSKDDAIAAGAIAFFGEKYGERVRVISVGDFSTELCGGTHVDQAADIHLFKIVSEASIAAGVRRIIAYTSKAAFAMLRHEGQELKVVRERLKVKTLSEIEAKLDKMALHERELQRELDLIKGQSLGIAVAELLAKAPVVQGTTILIHHASAGSDGAKRLRDIADLARQKTPQLIAVLGVEEPEVGKAFLLAFSGKSAPKGFAAQKLIQSLAPFIEGRGGGKPDLAQAGGTRLEGLATALLEAEKLLRAACNDA